MNQKFNNLEMHSGRITGPFLRIPENELAFQGLKQLQKSEKNSSQCLLYIYGQPGTGKSHLVKHYLQEFIPKEGKYPYLIFQVSEYAAQFAEAAQNKTIHEFQEKFTDCQLLIMEDLTAIQGRKETQKHLVSTIDQVLKNGGKCIVTCTKMPAELESISKRLINRCHGGICLEIQIPKKESRHKLIDQMASYMQIPVPQEAIKTLASSLTISPRELESTLIQLEAIARMKKTPINNDFVKLYLAGEISPPSPSLTQITRSVSKQFQVSVKIIRSSSRLKGHVLARQIAMFLMREMTEEPLQNIAKYFQRKNHSTVTHACHNIQKMENKDVTLKHHLKQIRNSLGISTS